MPVACRTDAQTRLLAGELKIKTDCRRHAALHRSHLMAGGEDCVDTLSEAITLLMQRIGNFEGRVDVTLDQQRQEMVGQLAAEVSRLERRS